MGRDSFVGVAKTDPDQEFLIHLRSAGDGPHQRGSLSEAACIQPYSDAMEGTLAARTLSDAQVIYLVCQVLKEADRCQIPYGHLHSKCVFWQEDRLQIDGRLCQSAPTNDSYLFVHLLLSHCFTT